MMTDPTPVAPTAIEPALVIAVGDYLDVVESRVDFLRSQAPTARRTDDL
jgi:hypothetical protein